MTMEATHTYTDNPIADETSSAFRLDLSQWLNPNKIPTHPTTVELNTLNPSLINTWLSPKTIDEAKLRFKDALEEAEEEEDTPSDIALTNALRAVQFIERHCPQDVSSTVVLDGGIEATVRGSNRNYISVECKQDGDVLVMFNVRSYAQYKGMDEAEREGFLKTLLETLRY